MEWMMISLGIMGWGLLATGLALWIIRR